MFRTLEEFAWSALQVAVPVERQTTSLQCLVEFVRVYAAPGMKQKQFLSLEAGKPPSNT